MIRQNGLGLAFLAGVWVGFSSWLAFPREACADEIAASVKPAAAELASSVRYGKERLSLEEMIAKYANSSKLEKYREQQAKTQDSERDQIKLADWCKQYGLPEQERAHLLRALDFDPDNEAIRKRVGHTRGEREWLSKEAMIEKERRESQQANATKMWAPRIEEWQRLTKTSPASREKVLAHFQAIRDPLAIPALETALAKDRTNAPLLVEILGRFDTPRAMEGLVTLAVDSEYDEIRLAATEELKKFDRYSYVPLLHSGFRGPIVPTSAVTPKGKNVFEYVQSMKRAAQEHDEILDRVKTIEYRGKSTEPLLLADVRRRMFAEDAQLNLTITQENLSIENRNTRISAVLEATTGHKPPPFAGASPFVFPKVENPLNNPLAQNPLAQRPAAPNAVEQKPAAENEAQNKAPVLNSSLAEHWWKWWKDENEVTEQRKRGEVRVQQTSYVSQEAPAIPNPYGSQSSSQGSNQSSMPRSGFRSSQNRGRHECFVAGTMVWTIHGCLPIETIRTGDLVLTKNIANGELEFKAVVRPTIRPTTQLVRVTIGEETFTCTGGHFFWTVSEGWKKARDLQPGMMVQGASGTAQVQENSEGPQERTYNLVMADNHNYFVGQARLLSHDNTDRTVIAKTPTATTRAK